MANAVGNLYHGGSWNLFGVRLPELGWTEAAGNLFSGGRTSDLSQAVGITPSPAPAYNPPPQNGPTYGPGVPQQLPQTGNPSNPTITNNPQPQQQNNTGNNFDSIYNQFYQGWGRTEAEADYRANPNKYSGQTGGGSSYDPYAQMRSDISSGWDNYINSLNSQLNDTTQRDSQNSIIESSYSQGNRDLTLQRDQGLEQLNTTQTKTLRDLAGNVRNALTAGNTFLGARGAGDSSATNQYSYALNKEATKNRSDVMMNVANQQARLGEIYQNEMSRLSSTKEQNLLGVVQWFAQTQQQIKQAIATGQLSKQQDINSLNQNLLNQGIAYLNQANQQAQTKYNTLQTWAANNSKSLAELKTNMAGIAQYQPNVQQINGTPTIDSGGNYRLPSFGYGSTDNTKKDLFGNPIA